jgi:hypothetical protein
MFEGNEAPNAISTALSLRLQKGMAKAKQDLALCRRIDRFPKQALFYVPFSV